MPYPMNKMMELHKARKKAQESKKESQNLRTSPRPSERDQSTRKQDNKSRTFDEPKPLPSFKTKKKPIPRRYKPKPEGMQLLKRKKKPQQGKSGGYLA